MGTVYTARRSPETLTGTGARPILIAIERDPGAVCVENETLKKLESRVDDLIGTCRQLKKDHHAVKDEHAKLIEKTRIARARVESMIGRLKALERGS